ncbi:MAG: hydroxymethylbilane synthase, partial [Chloroflexota bacterium]
MLRFEVGTRGSALALRQTEQVVSKLRRLHPEAAFNIKTIRTEGDRASTVPLARLGGQGLFIKELEAALLRGEIHLAVHSLKDVPTEPTAGLVLGAVLRRADARDALVSRWKCPLAQLPTDARLGTSSPRRAAQLKAFRNDFQIVPLRGNVDTKLAKAGTGEYDGIILAAAGLGRLDLSDRITECISPKVCLPAVGQGAVTIEWRAGDDKVAPLVSRLNHIPSWQAIAAERAFLRGLGGGCQMPIAALALVDDGAIRITGMVAAED